MPPTPEERILVTLTGLVALAVIASALLLAGCVACNGEPSKCPLPIVSPYAAPSEPR